MNHVLPDKQREMLWIQYIRKAFIAALPHLHQLYIVYILYSIDCRGILCIFHALLAGADLQSGRQGRPIPSFQANCYSFQFTSKCSYPPRNKKEEEERATHKLGQCYDPVFSRTTRPTAHSQTAVPRTEKKSCFGNLLANILPGFCSTIDFSALPTA